MTGSTKRQIGWNSIEELCDREFGKRPSPANLSMLKGIEDERADVREFVERVFRLMAIGRFDPVDMTPALAWVLAVLIPRGSAERVGRIGSALDIRGTSSLD
jgi:hypothetical protein